MSAPVTRPPLALVTGASGALGGAIAELLAHCGWSVIGTHRTTIPSGRQVRWLRFDAAGGEGSDDLRAALDEADAPLAAAFCCIGAPSGKQPISDTDPEEFAAVYAANAVSFVRTWHLVQDRARAAGTSVLALSSDAATSARPGNGPYSAAKAALHALVATLAKEEHEHGVRVNAVAPSLVDSPLAEEVLARKGVGAADRPAYYAALPWGRPLSIKEVAAVAVDIATAPHWRYASGHVFPLTAAIV